METATIIFGLFTGAFALLVGYMTCDMTGICKLLNADKSTQSQAEKQDRLGELFMASKYSHKGKR